MEEFNPIVLPSPQANTSELQSNVLIPPGEKLLSDAITQTFQAPLEMRVVLFKRLVQEIEAHISANVPEKPWTCTVYIGTRY